MQSSLEKTLMLGKIEGRRKRGRQRMRWLDVITDSMDILGHSESESHLVMFDSLWPHGLYYTVHGILQARILEWVAFPFFRGSSQLRTWTQVSCIGRQILYYCATWVIIMTSFYLMMLWKCCTQYASKFGKLSSGHRTGKGRFSFQSQRKAIQRMLKLPHSCTHLTC